MRRNIGSPCYYVNWIKTAEFPTRPFPMVYFSNGHLSYSLLAFLKNQYGLGFAKNTSGMNDLFRVVGEINLFYEVSTSKHESWHDDPRLLIIDYFEKKLHGTIRNGVCEMELYWPPSSLATIKRLLTRFNEYEKYCHAYLKTENMGTDDILGRSTVAYSKFRHMSKFSLLGHLMDLGKVDEMERDDRDVVPKGSVSHDNERQSSKQNRVLKYFPPNAIMDLIDTTEDSNQTAMYLLCAFTGLRESEALQVLISDIVMVSGSLVPDVILDHPAVGDTWDLQNNKLINRTEYLATFADPDFYQEGLSRIDLEYVRNPTPRVNVPMPFKAGWKTVELVNQDQQYGYLLEWTSSYAQLKFFQLLNSSLLNQNRANHPFLLCGTKGAPLRKATYEKRLERKSLQLLGQKYGTHTLRHFCGFYLNNSLGFTIDVAKRFLRHKSIESTEKYFHTSPEKKKALLAGKRSNIWEELDFSSWGVKHGIK